MRWKRLDANQNKTTGREVPFLFSDDTYLRISSVNADYNIWIFPRVSEKGEGSNAYFLYTHTPVL